MTLLKQTGSTELQRPPRYDLWPLALRSAMLLRGALVPCGPGVRGVAWPDCPSVRLATLQPQLTNRLIASHLTAAWVWGAASSPKQPVTLAARAGHHSRLTSSEHFRYVELRLGADEVTSFAGLQVTSIDRTVLDLLHHPERFGCVEIMACHMLLRQLPGGSVKFAASLASRRRPHARLARARLQAMYSHATDFAQGGEHTTQADSASRLH